MDCTNVQNAGKSTAGFQEAGSTIALLRMVQTSWVKGFIFEKSEVSSHYA